MPDFLARQSSAFIAFWYHCFRAESLESEQP